jgi:hypothetical protein
MLQQRIITSHPDPLAEYKFESEESQIPQKSPAAGSEYFKDELHRT